VPQSPSHVLGLPGDEDPHHQHSQMAARAEGRDPVNRVPSLPDVRLSHSSPRSISRPVASQPVPPRTITAGSKALRCGAWFNHSVSSAPERSSARGLEISLEAGLQGDPVPRHGQLTKLVR